MSHTASANVAQEMADVLRENVEEIRPRLRGWLHAATAPLAFVSFLVLMVVADQRVVRIGVAVFMVSALALFTCSAIYHTRTWPEEMRLLWKRIDHANIFLLIAGSYTPFCLLVLDTRDSLVLLSLVWVGALAGIAFRVFWVEAPRWLYVPLYVVLGGTATLYWGEFKAGAPATVLRLIVLGGVLYALGAVVYGFKRPNPWPAWFGFHEVFHALTILAFATTYVGLSLLAYQQS